MLPENHSCERLVAAASRGAGSGEAGLFPAASIPQQVPVAVLRGALGLSEEEEQCHSLCPRELGGQRAQSCVRGLGASEAPGRTRPRFVLLGRFPTSGFFEVSSRCREDYLLEQ